MTGDEDVSETTELIPVTEEQWTELREMKAENQSYDELIGLLVQEHKRRRLTEAIGSKPDGDLDGENEPRVRIEE